MRCFRRRARHSRAPWLRRLEWPGRQPSRRRRLRLRLRLRRRRLGWRLRFRWRRSRLGWRRGGFRIDGGRLARRRVGLDRCRLLHERHLDGGLRRWRWHSARTHQREHPEQHQGMHQQRGDDCAPAVSRHAACRRSESCKGLVRAPSSPPPRLGVHHARAGTAWHFSTLVGNANAEYRCTQERRSSEQRLRPGGKILEMKTRLNLLVVAT